jgi:hypothetical protein
LQAATLETLDAEILLVNVNWFGKAVDNLDNCSEGEFVQYHLSSYVRTESHMRRSATI